MAFGANAIFNHPNFYDHINITSFVKKSKIDSLLRDNIWEVVNSFDY